MVMKIEIIGFKKVGIGKLKIMLNILNFGYLKMVIINIELCLMKWNYFQIGLQKLIIMKLWFIVVGKVKILG